MKRRAKGGKFVRTKGAEDNPLGIGLSKKTLIWIGVGVVAVVAIKLYLDRKKKAAAGGGVATAPGGGLLVATTPGGGTYLAPVDSSGRPQPGPGYTLERDMSGRSYWTNTPMPPGVMNGFGSTTAASAPGVATESQPSGTPSFATMPQSPPRGDGPIGGFDPPSRFSRDGGDGLGGRNGSL